MPVVGAAIKAAEAGAAVVKENAVAVKDKTVQVATAAKDQVVEVATAAKDKAAPFIDQTAAETKRLGGVAKEKALAVGGAVVDYGAERVDKATEAVKSVVGKDRASQNKNAMIRQMDIMGIVDPKERANFMAQADHESGGFRRTEEGLNYTSVDRIRKTFGNNAALSKMSDEQVQGLVGNKEALANTVYGGRNGNNQEGDGYKFRGRGALQLTGRENYENATKALGVDLVNNPDLVSSDPDIGAKASAWFWKNRVQSKGAQTDINKASVIVNGGTNGLADRQSKYSKYMESGVPTYASIAATAAQPPIATPQIPPITVPKVAQAETDMRNVSQSPQKIQVTMPLQKSGRDVADRGIANIVTGGMAG